MWESEHTHIGFLTFAEEFAEAGSRSKSGPDSSPSLSLVGYFLFGRAIELGLKSFLVKSGYSEKNLRAIRHDLVKCLAEAKEQRIDSEFLLPGLEGSIELLNENYSSKEFEYFFRPMGMRLPEVISLEKGVHHLLDRLHDLYREELRKESRARAT